MRGSWKKKRMKIPRFYVVVVVFSMLRVHYDDNWMNVAVFFLFYSVRFFFLVALYFSFLHLIVSLLLFLSFKDVFLWGLFSVQIENSQPETKKINTNKNRRKKYSSSKKQRRHRIDCTLVYVILWVKTQYTRKIVRNESVIMTICIEQLFERMEWLDFSMQQRLFLLNFSP